MFHYESIPKEAPSDTEDTYMVTTHSYQKYA